jgi:hypothetical protein
MSNNQELSTADKVDRTITLYHWSKYVLIALLIVAILLVIVVQFVTLFRVGDTADKLLDCTEAKGACYQEQVKRSGVIVNDIGERQKQIVTIASYCAKQPGNNTLEQIEDCVNNELARK